MLSLHSCTPSWGNSDLVSRSWCMQAVSADIHEVRVKQDMRNHCGPYVVML